jgi:hypothetical protein
MFRYADPWIVMPGLYYKLDGYLTATEYTPSSAESEYMLLSNP